MILYAFAAFMLCFSTLITCTSSSKNAEDSTCKQARVTEVAQEKGNVKNVIYLHEVAGTYGSDEKAFEALIAQYPIVIVDFYASWCGPCRNLGNAIQRIALQMSDVIFLKVDIERSHALFSNKSDGSKSIPLLLLYKGGKKVKQVVGFKSEQELRSTIEELRH
jgi:thioredoxin 1